MRTRLMLSLGLRPTAAAALKCHAHSRDSAENAPLAAMITIYHNPACGTSRNTLGLIRNSGVEPVIVEYLKTPPSRDLLAGLLTAMRGSARDLLRRKGTPYESLRLDDPKWSEAELIGFMLAHPILIERPIVVTPLGVALCRPSEVVLDLLSRPQQREFRKEDGELVINSQGQRVAGPHS
jgi:arsenate reductase